MNLEKKVFSTILSNLCAGRSVTDVFKCSIIKQNLDMKHFYHDYIATLILLLPEDFSSDSKMHWRRGIILDSYIKAVLQNFVNQGPIMSTRSLKINAKEPMQVLKKVIKPSRDGVAAGCQ
jgi:hypothetical protein